MMYDFNRQLADGEVGEAFLDDFFRSRGHTIRLATREEQRQGVDRFITAPDGREMKVEYKTDHLAARTGNAFVETVSVDTAGKPGWALTTQADYVVYYVPPLFIVVLPIMSLRWALPGWMREYPSRRAANDGYQTHGLLVPLDVLREYAVQIFYLNGDS